MKKIFICAFIISFFMLLTSITTYGQERKKRICIYIYPKELSVNSPDNKYYGVGDGLYIDENNRVMVPIRECMEELGGEVEWNNKNKTAIVTYNNIKVEVPIGEKYFFVDGVKQEMDTIAAIKYARIHLPARAIFEAFGFNVDWSRERHLSYYVDKNYNRIDLDIDECFVILSNPAKELETCEYITDSDKIDSTKNIIYRIPMNTHGKTWNCYTTNYAQVPYININIPEVKVFNDIMLKKNKYFEMDFNKWYDEYRVNGYRDNFGFIDNNYSKYTFTIRDNILSVYQTDFRPTGVADTNAYNVINIDLVNKKVLTYFDMLDRFNLTLDDVKKTIIDYCNNAECNVFKEEIPMYINKYLENIYMKDRLFYEDYNPAVSLKDYDPTVHSISCWVIGPTKSYIYLNEEGNVCTNVAGAGDVVIEGVILKK